MTNKVVEAEVVEVNKNEVVALEDTRRVGGLAVLQNPQIDFFSSLRPETKEDKVKLYNAINNTEQPLADVITPITVVNVIAHMVQLENDDGEPVNAARTILIDKDGKTYGAVSEGVISSLQKIFAIFGQPPYPEGITVLPRLVKTNKGYKTLTLLIQE